MAKKNGAAPDVEVSLLPEDKGRRTDAERGNLTSALWWVCVVIVAGLTVAAGYLRIRGNTMAHSAVSRLEELQALGSQTSEVEKTVGPVKDMGRRIGLAKSALAQHSSGFPLMEVLESTAIPEVVVKQLNADAKGTVVLAGRGKTIAAVIRQILAWNNHPAVKEVKISGVANALSNVGVVEGVEFTATLVIQPELFTGNLK